MKLLFISLGCDKNLVDTEFMLGMIRDAGTFDGQPIEMTDDEYQADIIIINTCCFINDAKEESINTILEMAEHKRDAKLKALIVTGVAGPDGGTRECPVGLVYIGCCLHGRVVTERHLFAGDRMQVRKSATDAALHLLARTITEEGTICES